MECKTQTLLLLPPLRNCFVYCRTWLKGSAVLVVLLGLTWVFGFMYVNEDSLVFAYIFTILNSLQGLFIFIFHCYLDRKVCDTIEPPHWKTNNLPGRKQRRRSTAKLISAFVFATRIVQFLFYLNPKFQASSSFL